VLGAIIGMMAGVERAPGGYTLAGAPLTLAGCLLAVYGSWRREQQQQQMNLDTARTIECELAAMQGATAPPPPAAGATDTGALQPGLVSSDWMMHDDAADLFALDAEIMAHHPDSAVLSPSGAAATSVAALEHKSMRAMPVSTRAGGSSSCGTSSTKANASASSARKAAGKRSAQYTVLADTAAEDDDEATHLGHC